MERTCQKWFAKFRAGDLWLDGAPQSGRSVEADSDQIKTLIENNQCSTIWEIADIPKNIQIDKVIGENENRVFYFMGNN